jgi:hypothetical protein
MSEAIPLSSPDSGISPVRSEEQAPSERPAAATDQNQQPVVEVVADRGEEEETIVIPAMQDVRLQDELLDEGAGQGFGPTVEMDDFPLGDGQGRKGFRQDDWTGSNADTSSNNSACSTESNWLPIPEAICVYHQRGSCLRLNCRYFHGTAEQLADLRASGASHYRYDKNNRVELPKEGEGLPETTALDEPTVGIRFADAGKSKRKKPIVCLAFLSGTCKRSDCRFTHLPPNVRPLPATACAYFSVGTCKRSTCRYFHGTDAELAKLKAQGATMYNPQTNEAYEKIPDFDEPARPVSRNSTGSNASDGKDGHTNPPKPFTPQPVVGVKIPGLKPDAKHGLQPIHLQPPPPASGNRMAPSSNFTGGPQGFFVPQGNQFQAFQAPPPAMGGAAPPGTVYQPMYLVQGGQTQLVHVPMTVPSQAQGAPPSSGGSHPMSFPQFTVPVGGQAQGGLFFAPGQMYPQVPPQGGAPMMQQAPSMNPMQPQQLQVFPQQGGLIGFQPTYVVANNSSPSPTVPSQPFQNFQGQPPRISPVFPVQR